MYTMYIHIYNVISQFTEIYISHFIKIHMGFRRILEVGEREAEVEGVSV